MKKHQVNIEDEFQYFSDMKIIFQEEPEYEKDFRVALEEFGLSPKNIGVINTYAVNEDWEDIKDELDRRQIEYYEFDDIKGESNILFDINDLEMKEKK
jgi:hypothetical protein